MKELEFITCVLFLTVCGACAQESGTLIHKQPVEGMPGYTIIVREAREPEKRVYGVENTGTEELDTDEARLAEESQKAPQELTTTPEKPVSQSLRRERIPLRRNRYLLLKQQANFSNTGE